MSVHLFFGDEPEHRRERGDRVILDVIEPFVDRCVRHAWFSRYFFIRYTENGSHIRLRLRSEGRTLADVVEPELRAVAGLEDEPETDGMGLFFRSRHEALCHARWIPYVPETDRYGGVEGVEAAEEFFTGSSDLALRLLRRGGAGDSEVRIAQALFAMVVLLHVLDDDQRGAAVLAGEYGVSMLRTSGPAVDQRVEASFRAAFDSAYRRQREALASKVLPLWRALDAGETLPEPFDAYHRSARRLRRRLERLIRQSRLATAGRPVDVWLAASRRLGPSYLHMTNNRLGISPWEEAYLGHLAGRLLTPAEPSPSMHVQPEEPS